MTAPAGLTRATVWLSLWVSTPMMWSTLSASMGGAASFAGWRLSVPALARETARQDCDGSRRTADRFLIRSTLWGARLALGHSRQFSAKAVHLGVSCVGSYVLVPMPILTAIFSDCPALLLK